MDGQAAPTGYICPSSLGAGCSSVHPLRTTGSEPDAQPKEINSTFALIMRYFAIAFLLLNTVLLFTDWGSHVRAFFASQHDTSTLSPIHALQFSLKLLLGICIACTVNFIVEWFLKYCTSSNPTRLIKGAASLWPAADADDPRLKEDKCAICYDAFVAPIQLSCKHIFCCECVDVYVLANMRADRRQTCPYCSANLFAGMDQAVTQVSKDQVDFMRGMTWFALEAFALDILRLLMLTPANAPWGEAQLGGELMAAQFVLRKYVFLFWEVPYFVMLVYGYVAYGRHWPLAIPDVPRFAQAFEHDVFGPLVRWLVGWALIFHAFFALHGAMLFIVMVVLSVPPPS